MKVLVLHVILFFNVYTAFGTGSNIFGSIIAEDSIEGVVTITASGEPREEGLNTNNGENLKSTIIPTAVDFEDFYYTDISKIVLDAMHDEDGNKLTYEFNEVRTTKGGQKVSANHWRGELKDGAGEALLIQKDGRVFGTFTTPKSVIHFSTKADGTKKQIEVIDYSNFPNEDEPEGELQGLAQKIAQTKAELAGIALPFSKDETPVMDVLVIYSNLAMCLDAGLEYGCDSSNKTVIEDRIDLAEVETNDAFEASGINAKIRVVAKQLDTSGYKERGFDKALYDISDEKEQFKYVHDLKDKVNADLVAFIIDHSSFCGIAWMYNGNKEKGVSVTHRKCATGYYSFGHELAHNMGAHHDRTSGGCTQEFSCGYQNPEDRFRTVMAYNCPENSCPRVKVFSTADPNYKYKNQTIGSVTENNALLLNNVAYSISKFSEETNPPTKVPSIRPSISQAPSITSTYMPSAPPSASPTKKSKVSKNKKRRI